MLDLWNFSDYSRDHRFRGREHDDVCILFVNYQSGIGGHDGLDKGEEGTSLGVGIVGPELKC